MCGQCYAYNRYATLPDSNSLSMGFSGYQNVNSSSQRDNYKEYQMNIKTLGNPVFSRVFYTTELIWNRVDCCENISVTNKLFHTFAIIL